MIRLIDSTPIPLDTLCDWAKSNGRFRGMKVHVVYDPLTCAPRILDITDANINDAQIGRTVAIEAGATYVYDKGYCHYGWWRDIHAAGALFVTRPKINMGRDVVCQRHVPDSAGDGFAVIEDAEVRFASKGDSKLPMRLRRIKVRRDNGGDITLLTNDMQRSAVAVAALYKGRWQIELLFRWIKQHLRIRRFIGTSANAIRLQILAAMIAYALLRIAARTHAVTLDILRFTDLVVQCLFERRSLPSIGQPPPVHASKKTQRTSTSQLSLPYA
jgi:putative transposase